MTFIMHLCNKNEQHGAGRRRSMVRRHSRRASRRQSIRENIEIRSLKNDSAIDDDDDDLFSASNSNPSDGVSTMRTGKSCNVLHPIECIVA